jgi:hypothetical protein
LRLSQWHGREEALEAEVRTNGSDSEAVREYKEAVAAGDGAIAAVMCGEGIDLIGRIEPAADVIGRTVREAEDTIVRLQGLL